MPKFQNKILRSTMAAGLIAAGAMLVACGDDDSDTTETTTTTVLETTAGTTTTTTRGAEDDEDKVTPAAAQQLCDMISPEIANWRDQGSALAKVSFNGTVHNWAARNDGLNDEVLRDQSIVDDATSRTCPEVRQQAIDVLEVPDLASALAGFGN
ncbi:hypothetical protein HLB23_12175 [Nocardia uniformis]|uniref:Lipoprotein n=1 Tax=Nocardia uniformis TaxID=53432 RepID=A0A849C2E8_9NOCA|nr:hypothetical protein [Nocardia uniformis]NNH70610.1 hypothetical protein [Nocardia uniformis]